MFYVGFPTVQVPGSISSASQRIGCPKFWANSRFFRFLFLCGDHQNENLTFAEAIARAGRIVDPGYPYPKLFPVIYPTTLSNTTGPAFSCRKSYTLPKSGSQNGKNEGGVYESLCPPYCMKPFVSYCITGFLGSQFLGLGPKPFSKFSAHAAPG